jgi:hypothetical protein
MTTSNGVEENMNKEEAEQKYGKYSRMYGHGHFGFRMLLGIIILLAVFCLGMAAGRMHSGFHRSYYGNFRGGNMMYYYPQNGAYPVNGGPGPGMMNGYWSSATPAPATSTPVKK